MKKILTLLTFVFFTSGVLFGQCPETGVINGNRNFFNMNYATTTDASDAFAIIASVIFPLNAGGTITVPIESLGFANNGLRIRPVGYANGTFGGDTGSGNFNGEITINLTDGTSVTCVFENSSLVVDLPVELISFDGIKKDRQINLTWKTASEINNEGFVIERGHKTAEGIDWNRLDFIEGNGTTQALQAYSFTDQNPAEGINYYRLKQMDYDGIYEYSSTIAVEYSRKNEGISVGIFPNPAKDQLSLVNGEGKATIYNVLGQPVKHLIIDANQVTIQLNDLLNGQYYLQLLQEDGTIVTKQFAKMN